MPPERFPANDPREWLRRANSNLAQARRPEETVCLEDLCFQAQQAAEKALKSLLLARGCRPPYTHDLGALLRLIEKAGETVPADVSRIVRLTDYAVETRYPGVFEPVTDAEYQEAVALASRCVEWVQGRIE
jgi:HEPN domain-containing protein